MLSDPPAVIPANAGIQFSSRAGCEIDPSLRWDDTEWGAPKVLTH